MYTLKLRAFRFLVTGLAVMLLALPAIQAAQAAAGGMDCKFGDFGITTTLYNGDQAQGKELDVYESGPELGKIVVGVDVAYDFGVMRLTADGALDPSFGTNGFAPKVDFNGSWDYIYGVAALPDGKVVAAGTANYTVDGTHLAVVRYTTGGALDTSFATNGVFSQKIGAANKDEEWNGLVADASGNLYIAGKTINASGQPRSTVVKLNNSGALVGTWYADFEATTYVESFYAIALQSDGKIVAGGDAYFNGQRNNTLARFNTSGTLDTTFSGDGKMTFAYGSLYEEVRGLALQSDGKIIAGFISSPSSSTYDFGVARITTTGGLDTTFAGTGMTTRHVNAYDFVEGVVAQSDGNVVVAGYANGSGDTLDFTLLRYTGSGSLDTTFGNSGVLQMDLGDDDRIYGILQQADGKLVAAGYVLVPPAYNLMAGVVRLHDTDFNQRYGTTRVIQNTADILPGATGDILKYQVCIDGNSGPAVPATGFQMSTTGTTNPADIASAQVFYTGASDVFMQDTPFGSAITNPNGSFSTSGSQGLTNRINTFWLAYTIDPLANFDGSHLVDAELNTVSLSSGDFTPPITNPTGARLIYKSYPLIWGDPTYEWITRVVFNSLDNSTGPETGGYGDYSAQSTTLAAGNTYSLKVTANADGSGEDNLGAFIDWNQDYDFDDPGETYVIAQNFSATQEYSIDITVPSDAVPGTTRLRVALMWAGLPVNQGDLVYGEAEDYSLEVPGPCIASGSGTVDWSVAFAACPPGVKWVIPSGLTVVLDVDTTLDVDLEVQGALEATSQQKTLTLTGSGNQTLTGNPLTFYRLTLNKAASTDTVTINGKLKVTKKLTITKGKLKSASDYEDVEIGPAGTLELTSDISVGGNWTNNGTLIPSTYRTTFDGAALQTIGGSNSTSFYDLEIAQGAQVFLATSPSAASSIDNSGVLSQTQTVGPGVTASFLQISTDKYQGVEITTDASTDLGQVSVATSGNAVQCTDDPASPDYRNRCVRITAENAGVADLTVYTTTLEDDVDNDDLYQYLSDFTIWAALSATCGNTPGDPCAGYGVDLQSGENHFLIGSIDSPTAVELIHLDVHSSSSQGLFVFGLGLVICLTVTYRVRRKVGNN